MLVGLGFIPGADPFFGVAGGLATAGLLALYLRGTKQVAWRGVSIPLASFLMLLAGAAMSIAAVVFWLLPNGPLEPRVPLSVFGPLLFVAGWLSWKYREPAEKRSLRMAVAIYVFAGVAMTSMGLIQHFTPDPAAALAAAGKPRRRSRPPTRPAPPPWRAARRPPQRRRSRRSRRRPGNSAPRSCAAERDKRIKEHNARKADETRIFTTGRYLEAVDWRARQFLEKAAGDAGFAVVLTSMFLLGVWFVRSGVMEDTAAHRGFFRKLALYGLPVGIGLGALTGFITMSHTPGDRYDGWGIARGLTMLGNLPACLGYVGLVVTMLHSRTALSRIRVLAPAGRMALTNYLMQSLICMTYLLWLRARPLGHAARAAGPVRGGGVRSAGRVQPLVAGAIPLRPDGVALARLHVPGGPADAPRERRLPPRRRRRPDPARAAYFAGTRSMRRVVAASTLARVYSSGKYSPFSHIGARSR